jgi:hypothetical protein
MEIKAIFLEVEYSPGVGGLAACWIPVWSAMVEIPWMSGCGESALRFGGGIRVIRGLK